MNRFPVFWQQHLIQPVLVLWVHVQAVNLLRYLAHYDFRAKIRQATKYNLFERIQTLSYYGSFTG